MKTDSPISKSVLAIVLAGITLITVVLWFGLHSRARPEADTNRPVAEQPVVAPPETVVPKPASAPAKVVAVSTDNSSLAVIPISLTNIIDDAEATLFGNDAGMKTLPLGTQVYGGIEFWLQGMIHLQGLATRDDQHKNFRTNITVPLDETNAADGKVIARGKSIASIYLLAGTRFSTQTGEKVADVIWHYADGTAMRSEIKYNVHVRDWWRTPYEDPAQLPGAFTKVAWQGPHPTRKTGSIRLYRLAFVNPHPEKTIATLEFASALARPSLFVMALTLDPLMPGARPDNLTSQEMADPELNGQLQLFVQDVEGHPLPNAQVSASSRSKPTGSITQKYTTDNYGMALVRYSDVELETLNVSAAHENYSGKKMLWDTKSGDTVPSSYTLKLAAEVKIGGIVVDESENPIPGVTISLYRFWSGNDGSPDKKGEQPSFSNQKQTTDGTGRWQAVGLPSELMDHIGFEVKHPDYIGTSITVGQNSAVEKQLREGTHKVILKRGLDVYGRVLDDSDQPVSGATVWSGRKYYRDRKQTTADDQGHFSFHSVDSGDILFAVMAKGHAAASKTVNVHADMNEIVFRLKAGSVIRAHVQDESGQPIDGAWFGLSGSPGDLSYDAFEFSGNADKAGNFSWEGAPNQAMTFNISKSGFEGKDDVKLSPNQDNIVTLRKSRTLQGLVLDATTEKPVTKFTVRTGKASGDDSNVYGVVRYKDFGPADGRFSMALEEESDNAVAIYADGYADKVEKFPEAQNGTVQMTIRLKPVDSLSGVVLAPDGTPAPGVNVVATAEGNHYYVNLSGGRLRSYDSHNKITTTDAEGRFKIASAPDDGMIVAAGDLGFARAPIGEIRSSGTIRLEAWGRIEGTLKIGGQPGVGKDLLFNLSIPGIGTDFNGYKSTTDEQGKFTMEKVPPGEGAIVRLIKTSPNSWSHSDSTSVTVKAGETTQVSLGDNGAVLVGAIRFDNPPTNGESLNFEGHLFSQMPMPNFNSQEEAQAFYKTPEWQAMQKLRKNYSIEMKPNGSFTVDDVVPGNYNLSVSARRGGDRSWQNPTLGQGSIQVTVPDSFDPASPIDVGEVVLQPTPSAAPE